MTSTLYCGDCRDMMELCIADGSIDSIVTDPPYDLVANKKGGSGVASINLDSPYGRARIGTGNGSGGFMGQKWDSTGVAFDPATWREALRVLKPGGHLLAFGGTRTYHRMVCAIEDAGFEIRDQIGWLYGSGFPKSRNGEWGGSALKPAWEPIVLARKPLIGTIETNWREHGTGALNIDGCRVEVTDASYARNASGDRGHDENRKREMEFGMTAGKAHDLGRWPANIIHDGSDEALAAFPQAVGQIADASSSSSSRKNQNVYGTMARGNDGALARAETDKSAARFFYCAKASRKDRNDGCEHMEKQPLNWSAGTQNPGSFQAEGTDRSAHNHHPTVKPTELMRYLCRLVTPAGGLILDPFMGSGSTGRGAKLEGFRFVGIERDEGYMAIARARIEAAA